ncbi:hypothetical protein CERZMDRAFT_113450 [Cercospora zeae-maydis SCOH1-5]|uniref:Uncharacterized protein n=1 Tax=Cercospora zeae-maydis SCOH1-5 TaxID=717836 RepID=A0A6A6FA13_9PEZI|nr:hypothetical protein CERZMDRAFT_113450 [Cercospora zeae-maydis SCOH1-5]
MAAALKATKQRKRKGSLRKTALLGTRKFVTETRERRNTVDYGTIRDPGDHDHDPDGEWDGSTASTSRRLSLVTDHAHQHEQRKSSTELKSPLELKSPTSNGSYASTTDDDDVLTFHRPTTNYSKPHPSSTSYFPDSSVSRRPSHRKNSRSPLSQNLTSTLSTFPSSPLALEPHDYTETEYWGWVILIVTWLLFTVGMGSCLEIWSWAWDVGETPYAPPELEDDPTLPIVGYYPALIVLTGVVAWVWITVAWIGMKYFRHAKIEV